MKNIIENEVGAILTDILDDYKKGRAVDKMDIYNQPDKTEIMDILDRLFSIVYPGFFRDKTHKIYNIEPVSYTHLLDFRLSYPLIPIMSIGIVGIIFLSFYGTMERLNFA